MLTLQACKLVSKRVLVTRMLLKRLKGMSIRLLQKTRQIYCNCDIDAL